MAKKLKYQALVTHNNESKWVSVEIEASKKTDSKRKNRSAASEQLKKDYPNCIINQIIFN